MKLKKDVKIGLQNGRHDGYYPFNSSESDNCVHSKATVKQNVYFWTTKLSEPNESEVENIRFPLINYCNTKVSDRSDDSYYKSLSEHPSLIISEL